jgi:hypothetical protein
MDHVLTIILANDRRNFSYYFYEIGHETVISRNLRLLRKEHQELIVVSDYRERVCPDDCVTVISTNSCGTLKEAWIQIRDYDFKVCKMLYGNVVLSSRMIDSIHKDKRHLGLYGNKQRIFGFVLHRDKKNDFLTWSLREWRKHPDADLSNMIQFCSGKLLLSSDYSNEYTDEIELEALNDDRKHKRNDVV